MLLLNTAKDKTRFAHSRTHEAAITHTLTLTSWSRYHLSEHLRTLRELRHHFHLQTKTSFQRLLTEEVRTRESRGERSVQLSRPIEGKAVAQVGVMEQCVGGANYAEKLRMRNYASSWLHKIAD